MRCRFLFAVLAVLPLGWASAADSPAKPNILFILTDDHGWPTLGCNGGKIVPTPNLDNLAAEGVRFTAAYVTPQCTPTRAALLTGQHPARNRMWHVIGWYGTPWAPISEPPYRENLPRDAFTLAKGLKQAGYATAIAGKWHLTNNDDGNYTRLTKEAAPHYGFDFAADPGLTPANGKDKYVDHLTDETINFIERNRDRPWFCYLAHHTLHGVVHAPDKLIEKWQAKGYPAEGMHNATYLAAIEHLDTSIGRLTAALDRLKLRENTLIVFLGDNGGVDSVYDAKPFTKGDGKIEKLTVLRHEYDNAPLRAGKGTLYEAGIRVPCLVRWPGVAKSGLVCETPVQVCDWLPTLFAAAGAQLPKGYTIDGTNLTLLLRGGTIPDRSVYFYAPLYDLRWGATPAAAVRKGNYKLLEHFGDWFDSEGKYHRGHKLELYDLAADIGETKDLAAAMPDKAAELRDELHRYLKSVPAEIPGPNPHFEPERPLLETRVKPEWYPRTNEGP